MSSGYHRLPDSGLAAIARAIQDKRFETAELAPSQWAAAIAGLPDYIEETVSGNPASFPDGANNVPVKDLTVNIVPAQAGSGDPSPSNIRPITGWTGAQITRMGKNLFDKNSAVWKDGYVINAQGVETVNTAYSCTENYIPVGANKNYVFSGRLVNSQSYNTVALYDKNKTFLYRVQPTMGKPAKFTTPTNASFIRFNVFKNAVDPNTIQIEIGTTSTEYEAYNGTSYPVSWQSEAGIVCDGTLDATTGTLTVTHGHIAEYAGEPLPGEWISDRDVYVAGTSPTIGAQVVYRLATHITYQLTPQVIRTLHGENHIWADAGDVTVTYRADPALYQAKMTAALTAVNA